MISLEWRVGTFINRIGSLGTSKEVGRGAQGPPMLKICQNTRMSKGRTVDDRTRIRRTMSTIEFVQQVVLEDLLDIKSSS